MRLIDADALINRLSCFNDTVRGNNYFRFGIKPAIDFIENAPTIDAAPVVHGEWIFGESWMLGKNRKCSVCGGIFPSNDAWVIYYCPNCGAKMKG